MHYINICLQGKNHFSEHRVIVYRLGRIRVTHPRSLERTAVKEKGVYPKEGNGERECSQKLELWVSVHYFGGALLICTTMMCDPSPGLQNFPGNALSHRSECHHAFSLPPVAIIITEKKNPSKTKWLLAEDMLLEKTLISVDKLPSRKECQFTSPWYK